jgi:predicted amidophosphoribosyltransferase
MKERLGTLFKAILFLLEKMVFELICPVCHRPMHSYRDDPLCRTCRAAVLDEPFEPGCPLCGNRISPYQKVCGGCSIVPPPVQGFAASGEYSGEMKDLIKAYKYGGVTRLAPVLTELLLEAYNRAAFGVSFDGVLIIPRYRPAWRTFYPMKPVARRFCRIKGLPFMPRTLVKKKATPPQAALTGRARLKNLRGAFEARKNSRIGGLSLLLLDDVGTTGSTVRFAAEALQRAGARVWVLVIAKAR